MSVLDIDDNIVSEENIFLDIVTDEQSFANNYDYIYKYLSDHYTTATEKDTISDEHIDDYWLIIKTFNDKLGISMYGHSHTIDIGYNIYVHDNFWDCKVHNTRFIYDDIYSLNKCEKNYQIYLIDDKLFKMFYDFLKKG